MVRYPPPREVAKLIEELQRRVDELAHEQHSGGRDTPVLKRPIEKTASHKSDATRPTLVGSLATLPPAR